jgi:Fic family protein
MKPSNFTAQASGRCVKTTRNYYAFIPNPLPPVLEVDWDLARLISEADRAVAELSGLGRLLPNPHILMAPYMRREAVQSSRIENTQAGLEDLFAYENDESDQRTGDVREVANYVNAMERGLELLNSLPICSRLIREIHAILLDGVRGGGIFPGEYRTTQNWIGSPGCTLRDAKFIPVPPEDLLETLSQLERYINDADAIEPPLVRCAYLHYQFEAIHPFADGNGRVGRLLITLFLCAQGHLSQPLLYLSEFFEQHRDEYYRLLLGVSQKGLWREWLEFFLSGVKFQAQDACTRSRTLTDLNAVYREKLGTKRVPEAAAKLIDQIFTNPLVAPTKLAKEWDMSFPTVMKGVERLVELKIIHEITGKQRNRIYKATEVAEILERPATS